MINRFLKYVSRPDSINELASSDDCWIWTASKNKDGYGKFSMFLM